MSNQQERDLALPWSTVNHPNDRIYDAKMNFIAEMRCSLPDWEERQRFIVRAANNHHRLLAAAKLAMENCCDLIATEAGNALEAAIAAAEADHA